jgi:hypothetical protein
MEPSPLLPLKDLLLQMKKLLQQKFVCFFSFNVSSTFGFKRVFILNEGTYKQSPTPQP